MNFTMSFLDGLKHSLDHWQLDAIASMEKNHSVFCAVPTGSGKTILAEYAAFISNKVIYTSPLKAISNQKYHDFSEKFESVGILTGDVQVNEDANILILTTEILRKMLAVSDPRLNEVSWIIFDEVHYMNDAARGTVWEESLILLPDHIRCVFLSATVPNANAFAKWYSDMHSHTVDTFSISKRPVPLTFKVIADRMYDIDEFDSIVADEPTIVDHDVIKILFEEKLTPSIVFSCNKKRIETVARRLARRGGFIAKYESNAIKKAFDDLLRKVGTTETFHVKYREYAIEGVGCHHAGMLPYCKEIIEHLFCAGMLPILVSTETFAIGVNAPARSVVFESLEKFDGNEHRMFCPHEFVQMAGRAGRRGFDVDGRVIVLHDPTIPKDTVGKLVRGKPQPLRSSMYMSPQLVLQCVQRRIDIAKIIESSFETFTAFKPSDEELEQARAYERQTKSWRILLAHKELWKFWKDHECVLETGVRGKIVDAKPNYKVFGEDGNAYTRGIVEIIDVDWKKIKIKGMIAQLEIGKLKKRPHVDKPERYDQIDEYMQLSECNDAMFEEYRSLYDWLVTEKLIADGEITPLGEIACGISSMCPALGTRLLDTSAKDADIVHAIATFPAEATESIGEELLSPYDAYGPSRVNWNLVRAAGEWYRGSSMEEVCATYDLFEGNTYMCLTQVKNILMELIAVAPEKAKLESILEKIDRDCLKVKSLYL
jgi:superfamily II RNA helicase